VRLVREEIAANGGQRFGIISRVARQLGVGEQSLRNWVERAEVDAGARAGTTSAQAARIVELERENREVRRANDILKAASVFFATELDGRPKK
jgi:transposase